MVGAPELALERQLHAAVKVSFLLMRRARLHEPPAFSAALVFPVLRAPVSLSQLFLIFVRFLSREISSSSILVWVWACGAALILVKRSARVSRAALAMQWASLRRQIFLSLVFPGSGSAIFSAWEKGPLPFATRRWLILPSEWRWTLRLAWQRLDVSSLIYSLPLLLRESEIFSV